MEPNVEEAIRAKETAEKLFSIRDFAGAKRSAIKAQAFCPQLEGISHMVATYEIYAASEAKINGEIDLYSVLGLDPSSHKSVLKKQYKKLALLLHPDKNKTVGSVEAFKLVSDAWSVFSNSAKRRAYDVRRNKNLLAMVDRSNMSTVVRSDTFWTVCTSCRVQYEYLRKYVNKRLSCKNCRGVFVAVETGAAPVAFCPWSYTANNEISEQLYDNVSFQWNVNGNASGSKVNGKNPSRNSTVNGEIPVAKMGRPPNPKKRKIELGDTNGETGSVAEPVSGLSSVQNGFFSINPLFDVRKLLIDKARSLIRVKLEEIKVASKAEKNGKMTKRTITVPDPDFHDFDTDRSEEVFKAKQIWAIYDEEDGMPRLYCLIRQVLSTKPFQVHISYLNSKTDTEFGGVKWIESGFTKSCGSFRVFHSDVVDEVNIFSHLLGREKAGRGGCVRIYPKTGDIWAVYRNWSENWNRKTPKEAIHQYEMVEIVADYSEERGVCVANLVKLPGYKTVYQRDRNEHAVHWIPRREMLRFSHQVPACLLKGQGLNLPDGCWDLDPAATPEELLHAPMVPKSENAEDL